MVLYLPGRGWQLSSGDQIKPKLPKSAVVQLLNQSGGQVSCLSNKDDTPATCWGVQDSGVGWVYNARHRSAGT